MVLPADVDLFEETLTSVAGFEINLLMRQTEIRDFVTRGYGFADELTHSFVQAIYFPEYAFVVAPLVAGIDPERPRATRLPERRRSATSCTWTATS